MEQGIVIGRAQQVHQEIIRCKEVLTEGFLYLGQKLCECQKERLYLQLGYETFEEYLADPEIQVFIKRAWIYELMKAYRVFIQQHNIDIEMLKQIGITKLTVIAPIVNKENADELLEQAKTLTVSDLQLIRAAERQAKFGNVEEIILSLSARQVVELFLLFGNKEDALYGELLKHKGVKLVRDVQAGEVWRVIEWQQ